MQLQRIVRAAVLAPALAAVSDPASGQPISFTAAISKTAYGSGDYADTNGDWRAEGALRYEFRNRFHAGVGAEIGKLDEPYSDPSFTAAGIFAELGLGKALGDRWSGLLAGRYGWSHERVGEESDGLWAWGWQAGVVAGVDRRVATSTAVGLLAEATHLSLQRDEHIASPPSGLQRRGWRYAVGLTLRFGGRR